MAKPGFEKRLRDFLGSEEFEETINKFLKKHAQMVCRESEMYQGQGEFSIEVHSVWKDYLKMIESCIEDFQEAEGLSEMDFKRSVEDVADRAPMMVKLMIASWEFGQFAEICKDYLENDDGDDRSDSKYDDDEGYDSKREGKDEK
jgi:hypothetical protein